MFFLLLPLYCGRLMVFFVRNIGIALICIFITTLGTLGSWRGSMFVMMCVLLTCVDVAGTNHIQGAQYFVYIVGEGVYYTLHPSTGSDQSY